MRSSTDLIVSPEAEDDLRDIYGYTRETWSSAQADAYDAVLNRAFQRIQSFPELGVSVSSSDPAVRELVLRHHSVIYRHDMDANVVTILRIVNPRRLRR
jgi:toxin ParE1/3/4